MSFEFYALPNEQRKWLADQMRNEQVWILAWSHSKKYFEITNTADLRELAFESEADNNIVIFIGRRDISNIVWRNTKSGKRIDFIKSQAVQFVPSLTVRKNIVLEGRIGIMRDSEYNENDIDPTPVKKWFRTLNASLRSIMAKDYAVIQHASTGEIRKLRNTGVTQKAVEWRQKGKMLRQFPDGEVIFDVMKVE